MARFRNSYECNKCGMKKVVDIEMCDCEEGTSIKREMVDEFKKAMKGKKGEGFIK